MSRLPAKNRGRARRGFAVAIAALLTVCFAASSATAKEFNFRSCYPVDDIYLSGSSGWSQYWWSANPPIKPNFDCPNAVSLETTAPTILEDDNQVHFGAGNDMAIGLVKFRARIDGDFSGYALTVRGCDDCAPVKTLAPPPGASEWTEAIDMLGQKRFVVRAECIQFHCTSRGKLSMNSFEIAMEDNTYPWIYTFDVVPEWTRSEIVEMTIATYDAGASGIGSASARFAGESSFWGPGTCALHTQNGSPGIYAYPLYCATSHSNDGYLDLRGRADGHHTVEINATDGAGNAAPTKREVFKIDRTAPATPVDVTIDGAEPGGWTSRQQPKVTWKNREEAATTPTQSGILYSWYDLEPRNPATPNPESVRQYTNGLKVSTIPAMQLPADGEWDLYTWTEDRAGNVSGKQMTFVGRDIDQPQLPVLTSPGWLSRTSLASRRLLPIVFPAGPELESKVCGAAVTYNGQSDSEPTLTHIERDLVRAAELPADLPNGSSWVHVRSVSCAGLASSTAHLELHVDSAAPTVELIGAADSTWQDSASPRLRATDAESGVTGISYRIGLGPLQVSTSSEVPLTLAAGKHQVSFTAEDAAGNRSPEQQAQVWIDDAPPTAGFDPRTGSDPTLLTGVATDAHSGIDDVSVSLVELGATGSAPIPLHTEIAPTAAASGEVRFSARVEDDRIPPGDYRALVTATDRLGHASTSSQVVTSGGMLEFRAPIREQRQVTADLSLIQLRCVPKTKGGCSGKRSCPARSRRCENRRTVLTADARPARTEDLDRAVALVGGVQTGSGRPLPGVGVEIQAQIRGGATETIGTAITDASGRYTFELPAGPDRRLFATLAPTLTTLGATDHAELGMRASGTLRVSLRKNSRGVLASFRGRLRGLVAGHSPENAFVILEFKNRDGWQNGLRTAVVDARGTFVARPPYQFDAIPGKRRSIRIRARIRSEGTLWPYRDGYTNAITVKIPRG